MINKYTKTVILILLLATSSFSYSSNKKLEQLISGCSALTKIYEKRDEKRLLASIMTSNADALSAGYCLGYLEARANYYCWNYDTFKAAEFIAAQNGYANHFESIKDLMKRACSK